MRSATTSDTFIPLSAPCLRGNEWAYVKECLDTNWVSSAGSYVERFERMAAAAVGTAHAVATVNGTAALHVALLLAGVGAGDEVAVSDLTFIAPANAVRYVGAWPVFVDAEPAHWQMDPQKLRDFLRRECVFAGGALKNRHTGRRVAAVLPVHILGHPCDMSPILEEAGAFGLPVIEDATESLGVLYDGRPAGSFGRTAVLSFNGNKILTTGGGGMLVTNDEGLARRARHLTTQAKDDPVEYVHGEVGYNYRLPNVLAAVGTAQMERLELHVASKRATAKAYTEALSGMPGIRCPSEPRGAFSTFWLYTILVEEAEAGADSRALLRRLAGKKIESRPLWQPMHLSPAHRGSWTTDCAVSARLYRDALSLPCSVGISPAEIERVVAAIADRNG
ncbi:MAG: LegC family aminotransferase [Thermodesulfobacteriota bacterium]